MFSKPAPLTAQFSQPPVLVPTPTNSLRSRSDSDTQMRQNNSINNINSNKNINSPSNHSTPNYGEDFREVQHQLDKANQQINLLKTRLSMDGRRSTIEKEKIEKVQLTAKIEGLKGKIEELNFQILYGNSQKDKEIQNLKADIQKLKISQTRHRIQLAGTGERGSFLFDSNGLPNSDSNVATSSSSSSSDVFPTPFSPSFPTATTSPFSPQSYPLTSPSISQNPTFVDDNYYKIQQQQIQDKKKLEEYENIIKESNNKIDDLKSKILDLEALYGREKELRATDKESWSNFITRKRKRIT